MAAVTTAVILEPKKIKSLALSTVAPLICHEVMGPDAMILSFLNVEFQASSFTLLFHFLSHIFMYVWRRKWQATPEFLPGESHGQRSLVGYSPWGCKESDMTE